MYEAILNGVLHFFAIFAAQDPKQSAGARELVVRYLTSHLGIQKTDEYLGLFDELLDLYGRRRDPEFGRANALKLCEQLRQTLSRRDQFVLLLRLVELLKVTSAPESGAADLPSRLAAELDFTPADVDDIRRLVFSPGRIDELSDRFLWVGAMPPPGGVAHRLAKAHFRGAFILFKPRAIPAMVFTALSGGLTLDDTPVSPGGLHLFGQGAVVRDVYANAVYSCEIEAAFPDTARVRAPLVFEAREVDFQFPGTEQGLRDFSFRETGGRLVGVMGGSGVGKSTLLSILNGTLPPNRGAIAINGLDLYREPGRLEGVIGFVPQDDLLFEDLTVFQNLYFNAKLCLAHWDDVRIRAHVRRMLDELNQREIANLRVGSPLDKSISGGQRKRLNIALELMREPAILLVDEPTSGLSSSDSENVMNLLKAQAAQGRLAIVIIHQPSSALFKMFDALWLLDKGGYPIFMGHPLDALRHFRAAIHLAGAEESVCPQCGNVNPEQVFSVIETRRMDEAGQFTRERRYPPQFWHDLFQRENPPPPPLGPEDAAAAATPPPRAVFRPSLWGQVGLFLRRNVLSKLANRPYLAINLLEAPLLGWIVAWLTRTAPGETYVFADNPYLVTYFFMGVIVAIFMGLSVSAEEIVRDRAILQRERFLHLSWLGYGLSKFIYLTALVAVQMGLVTLVGVVTLEIPDLFWKLWGVLFSCAVFACALGLNISSAFKAAVTIYILIPLLLIPQMLLSGIVIGFGDLQARDVGHGFVPWTGEMMAGRWGVEALAVEQYRANRYQRRFFETEREISRYGYLLDELVPEVRAKADFVFLKTPLPDKPALDERYLRAAGLGLRDLELAAGLDSGLSQDAFTREIYGRETQEKVHAFLQEAAKVFEGRKAEANERKRQIQRDLVAEWGAAGVAELQRRHHNKDIERLVRNRNDLETIRLSGERWVQVSDPVFQPVLSSWGRAPFMAGQKKLGPLILPTYAFNLGAIWAMTAFLLLALYGKWMCRALEAAARFSTARKNRR